MGGWVVPGVPRAHMWAQTSRSSLSRTDRNEIGIFKYHVLSLHRTSNHRCWEIFHYDDEDRVPVVFVVFFLGSVFWSRNYPFLWIGCFDILYRFDMGCACREDRLSLASVGRVCWITSGCLLPARQVPRILWWYAGVVAPRELCPERKVWKNERRMAMNV